MKLVVRGFTLVELVVVLVLVGIAGAVIMSRFLNPNAFNIVAARDAIVTSIRAAQQASLGRANVSFHIDKVGDEFVLTALTGLIEIRRIELPAQDVTLETGTALTNDSCASAASFSDEPVDFVLNFDTTGNLSSFSNDGVLQAVSNPLFNGVRICLNDTVDMSVCVSPAGHAHAGDCDA